MTLKLNLLFQLSAILVQVGNMLGSSVPAHYKPALALAVGLFQAIIAWRAHYFNTDGTPQSVGRF